jgi:hypothetical protein
VVVVDVIRRDLREIVEHEIKGFLEYYEDCKVVDEFRFCWHSLGGRFDAVINGLPCFVTVYFADIGVVLEMDCSIEYHLERRLIDKLLGWVRILWVGDKCYVLFDTMDKNIDDVAREIVEKVEVDG